MFGRGGGKSGSKSGARREPGFEGKPKAGDFRVTDDDRPSGGKSAKRDAKADTKRALEPAKKTAVAKKKKSRSVIGGLIYWAFVLGIWGAVGSAGAVAYYASQLPPIDQLAIPKRPPNIAILAADGSVLANRGDSGGPAVRLSELPPYLPKAFVAIEDRRFYSHYGIDPVGILRALARNVTGKGTMQGGSTLTQQLAKNLFLTQERTIPRKIQEAILAIWLEHRYSKDQILELYLNRVYFGSGSYGVEAAATKYFGHDAREVTLPEAAVLAGLMKAPTKLAPNRNPEGATERAAQVITAMAQEGHITEAMAKLALSRPASAVHEKGSGSLNYAADYVMDILDDTIGAIDEDLVVSTTLDGGLQSSAERALTEELDRKGVKYGVSQGALVALDPGGAIRALVGGRNYADSQFDRAVAAHRQPGSSFKPFVYLTGLEHGLTPDTVREDAPINVKGWKPENYSHEYFGPVTLTNALALSLNTVAVRVGMEAGPRNVVQTAHRLGITSDLQPNASIALGTSEVTPLELVGAYAPFANGGIGVQPYVLTKVRTADGKLLFQRRTASSGRVIEPQYVSMMNSMMEETLLTGTAKKAELPGWQAAGKTGTSQDYRDAWFVGYTSHLVAGVWLGNDDNSPTKKASGGNLPVEIWSRFMKDAHRGVPSAALPGGAWRPADQPETPNTPWGFGPGPMAARDPAGQPAIGNQASAGNQSAAHAQPRTRGLTASPGAIDALLPPEDIPGASDGGQQRIGKRPPRSEPNFFEKLFGG